MNSNMLAGERRWASARRGGMTSLGKVAVPKPLNLPSQRLENHGLDPNVEIVPKGTLSWGSRPSSSGSNPWISSSLSPNGDGGTVSPSHLSGRPSSGGSGTRPSTAGSDRAHEPVANAWSSNSRPSSSSGTLSSNQTSTSLRPRSAENRPNSSQLSRFADPVSKSSAAWGPSTTAERLGVKSSKEDGFSLSSGDFPTLGAEKDNPVKNVESEDHGRPSSASSRILQTKEDTISQADVKRGTVDTWRADGSRNVEDDIRPNMEKWQGDPNQYFNVNAPQHFDAWRGPPMNGPAGVWYGGRPQGPAFGAPVAPGGFPMEPFPYYRPQRAPPPLAGSQPVPPPGAGPRGPHPKNGDLYRPQMPDAYARPGMPFGPGFYPGPPGPMAFEGYYGPPMPYCNNERDIPYRGMASGPPVYNGYPAPAPDIGHSHGRPAGHGPAGKTLSDHVEADHLEDTQGPKRVPLKNHNERDQRGEGENAGHKMQPNVPYPGKNRYPTIYSRKNEWGAEEDTEEAMFAKRSENSSHSYEHRVHSADSTKAKSFEGMGNVKTVYDNRTNQFESVLSFPADMPQLPLVSEKESSLPAATKNSDLMHKIDGLNAKHRVSDIQSDAPGAYNREEERIGSQIVDMKINNYTGGVRKTTGPLEKTPVSVPHEVTVPVGEPVQPIAAVSRRPYHGGQGRVENRGKGKVNSQDPDGWRRRPLPTESSSVVTATNTESAPNINLHGPNVVGEASENSMVNSSGRTEGDSADTYDSTDVQRAKMRELAKQRALQLQKEEEERIREQRAKAKAKLEELNRRTLAVESVNQKTEKTQAVGDGQEEQEESRTLGEPVVADLTFQEPGLNLVSNLDVAAVDRDSNATQAGESVEVSRNFPLEMQQTVSLESNVYPSPMHEDARGGSDKRSASQLNDGGFSRHKRPGYKQKQNNSLQKSLKEKSVSNVASEAQKDHIQASTIDVISNDGPSSEIKLSESIVLNTSNSVGEPSAHQRRKSNRSGKNKHKLDETPADPTSPPVMSYVNPEKKSTETGESKDSSSKLDGSVTTMIEPDRGVPAQEVRSSLPNEESQSKGSNQWKQNPSRRLPRNQQANRFTDKLHGGDAVVWAPVRTQNKDKGSVEESQKSVHEPPNSIKVENIAQNSSKGKRAEMERYVPKPVAKELAQQGSIPPPPSSISTSRSNEGPGQEQSSIECNEEDGSHNKHKKDHGMWRQRGSTDSSNMNVVQGPSPPSEPASDVQQSKELVESVKSETNSATAETKAPSIINTSDGYNMASTTTASTSKYPSAKDQGATGRGKRHVSRGSRSTGNNPDLDNTFSGEIDGNCSQSAAPDVNQTDRNTVSKERSFGERTSHWQPKSHSNSANDQNRTTGSESLTTEVNRLSKKDHLPQKVQVAPRCDKESGSISQPQPGQSVNVKSNVAEESNAGHHQEFDREKKQAPAKGPPYSPNQDPVGAGELAPTGNKGSQIERNMPSGSRRNGRQNNRPVRGHESRGDWSSGYDHRPAIRDRHRQNVHYEYQPVGPFKGNKAEKVEEPRDGFDNTDQRHRERGQNYSKRGGGNFYRRQSGAAHMNSGRE